MRFELGQTFTSLKVLWKFIKYSETKKFIEEIIEKIFTDILAGFTFNNRVLRLPAIILLNTTFRPGNSGLLSFRVETSCSIKRLLEDEELCCWIEKELSIALVTGGGAGIHLAIVVGWLCWPAWSRTLECHGMKRRVKEALCSKLAFRRSQNFGARLGCSSGYVLITHTPCCFFLNWLYIFFFLLSPLSLLVRRCLYEDAETSGRLSASTLTARKLHNLLFCDWSLVK